MKRFDIEVENGRAYLVGNPDGKYVSYSDAVEANYAVKQSQQDKPVAWKHDCAALLMNDVELWVRNCPHCGKPRAAQPPAVPDGYALVRQEDLRKLKASINGECYMGQAWEAETVSAMLDATKP